MGKPRRGFRTLLIVRTSQPGWVIVAMSTVQQFVALGVKDLHIMRRSKLRCCCELLVPMFILPFLIGALIFSIRNVEVIKVPQNETNVGFYGSIQRICVEDYESDRLRPFRDAADELGYKFGQPEPYEACVVRFQDFDVEKSNFNYFINTTGHNFGLSMLLQTGLMETGWLSNNPFDTEKIFPKISDIEMDPEAVGRLLHTIDRIILHIKGKDLSNSELIVQPFAVNEYTYRYMNAFLPFASAMLVAASLIPMALVAKNVIVEVEAEIKVYMLIMGMSRTSYYFSHFVNGLVKMVIVMSLLALPVAIGLNISSFFSFLVIVVLFTVTCVSYALFWATLIPKPGLCMTIIILSWMLLCALSFISMGDRLDFAYSCFTALNPAAALQMGLHDLRFYDRRGVFPWPGNRFFYEFNIFFAALFLILDSAIIVALTMLLDLIVPTPGQPGLPISALWKGRNKVFAEADDDSIGKNGKNADFNADFESMRRKDAQADIEVKELKKRWDWGDYAVSGVSFSAYRGEITCLLGHNGAGKSTTFSCLTGHTQPTAGTVRVCGMNVATELSEVRRHIGYCPQGNPLFDRLTCIEHLRLAAKLRGSYCGDADVQQTLSAVGLGNAMNKLACELSGGMKRKLCVAMALVGRSQVVLLDEPTAGMDPTARKQIGEILDQFKRDRTIVLTTHYMDEADLLSDRIVILVKGKVICNGTSEFLKKRFGTGFLLTISMTNGNAETVQRAEHILHVARELIPEAKFSGSPAPQFTLNLPHESRPKFAALFHVLESRSRELGIDSFGLSVNTLEQVFIRVGEKAEGHSNDALRQKIVSNSEIIRKDDDERSPNPFAQWLALCIRNFIYWRRHPVRTLMPLIVIILCFIFLGIEKGEVSSSGGWAAMFGNGRALQHSTQLVPRSQILHGDIGAAFEDIIRGMKQCNLLGEESLTAEVGKSHQYDVPPLSFGLFPNANKRFRVAFNRFLSDGYLMAINLFSNLQLGQAYDSIRFGIVGQNFDFLKLVLKPLMSVMLENVFMIFGLTFGMAMLLAEVVTERVIRFKHQIYLCGVRGPTYWLAQLSTDFVYFLVLAVMVFCGMLFAANQRADCAASVIPVWIMYFIAASLASYVLSFAFESATKGMVFVLAFHTVIPVVVFICMIILLAILMAVTGMRDLMTGGASNPSVKTWAELILGVFFPALPLFATSFQTVAMCPSGKYGFAQQWQRYVQPRNSESNIVDPGEIFLLTQQNILEVPAIRSLISLTLSIILYGTWLILIETGMIRKWKESRQGRHDLPMSRDDDSDVTDERRRMEQTGNHELALACRSLYKFYNPHKCAVENLTFGVASTDCFGLLGINGAGKTTTFDMLSNITKPTAGHATIHGIATDESPTIGYCPQFDALSPILTGAETLHLIGRLNGFSDVSRRVQLVLECVMMEEHSHKEVAKCSGGQKRRISIAVCLMSGSRFLMLDEPTAGVDPATRRQIWDLLTAMRMQSKAILLTTHSMEECEALCTQIGFLRDGRLRGIGTSQHLKSRYGNTYNLTLIQSNPDYEAAARLDSAVQHHFRVERTLDSYHLATLAWSVPRRPDLTWSQMYAEVERFVNNINSQHNNQIKDFYLIQDSLEQVFTRLATNEDPMMAAPVQQQVLVQQISVPTHHNPDPPPPTVLGNAWSLPQTTVVPPTPESPPPRSPPPSAPGNYPAYNAYAAPPPRHSLQMSYNPAPMTPTPHAALRYGGVAVLPPHPSHPPLPSALPPTDYNSRL